MKKKLTLLLILCLTTGILASCSHSDDRDTNAAETTQKDPAQNDTDKNDTDAEKKADNSAAIGKVWKIIAAGEQKPFAYTGKNEEFTGIDVDLIAAVAKDQGFLYELNSLDQDTALTACRGGQMDALIGGIAITEEWQQEGWIFSDSYYPPDSAPAEGYGMAIFREENRELLELFNAGLQNIRKNGTYDEILQKYSE